jgi:hypothetical protein
LIIPSRDAEEEGCAPNEAPIAPCTTHPLRAWCLAVGLGRFAHVLACPVLPLVVSVKE